MFDPSLAMFRIVLQYTSSAVCSMYSVQYANYALFSAHCTVCTTAESLSKHSLSYW